MELILLHLGKTLYPCHPNPGIEDLLAFVL